MLDVRRRVPAMTTYETVVWYKKIILWQDLLIVGLVLTIIYLIAVRGL